VFDEPAPTEVTYALGRLPERTYVSRTFSLDLRNSQDYGQPARYVSKVFDEVPCTDQVAPANLSIELEETVIMTTPGGRKQVKFQIARETGSVREIQIQKAPTDPNADRMEVLLTLDRAQSRRFIEVVRALDYIPVEDSETVRLDDELLRTIFTDPAALDELYGRDPERLRSLIESDASADDVIALARRHAVVAEFRSLLDDDTAFEAAKLECGGPEAVWQRFLEMNPWILGISLAGQLLTSWNDEKLEQTVAGFSVAGSGKRADALLRTNGQLRCFVFAEIKHHKTPLLDARPYRAGCWGPSGECAGGVAQAQLTVDRAVRQLGERLVRRDEHGTELPGEETFLVRPRSFLIVGNLGQFRGEGGGVNPDKYRSFELFRRHLEEPDVITFDELLARAEWHVSVAETRPGHRGAAV
jgi:hypothetical protein